MARFTKGSAAAKAAGRKGALVTNAKKRLGYKPPVTTDFTTYYILCVDASGSMRGYETQVEATIRQQLDLIALSSNVAGRSVVSIYDFGAGINYAPRQLLFKSDPKFAKYHNYRAVGNTPLYDCLGKAITDHQGFESPKTKDAAILILITDGAENWSKTYNSVKVTELLSQVQSTDRWTIAAYVPHGYNRVMEALGIPPGNIKEWERSTQGFQDVQTTNMSSTQSYGALRSSGITKSTEYFAPNLAKLTTTKVKKELTNRSKDFKVWTVSKETGIKEFVEDKGVPFVLGAGYYPLTKTEKKVQKNKQVVLVKKGTKEIYAGAEARDLLGLPDADAKVDPGNHGDWDIYIQSTSINRKLVRGTKLLYNLTHTVDSKPTWEAKP